jgi:hypothetical protein
VFSQRVAIIKFQLAGARVCIIAVMQSYTFAFAYRIDPGGLVALLADHASANPNA